MIFNDVNLLRCVIELDGLVALVAAGAVFLLFKWLLRNMIFGILLKHFSLFGKVPGAM